MKKEDILARSRKERTDEGLEHALHEGRRIGIVGLSGVVAILVIFNFIQGLNSYSVFALYWIYLGLEYYGKYRFSKKRSELIAAISGIAAGIIFLVAYIMGVLVQK